MYTYPFVMPYAWKWIGLHEKYLMSKLIYLIFNIIYLIFGFFPVWHQNSFQDEQIEFMLLDCRIPGPDTFVSIANMK